MRDPPSAEGLGAAAPAIILVEPQLAENIGMAARAMANFGLSDLRLVTPPPGWAEAGRGAAAGAAAVLERAQTFSSLPEAIADLGYVLATTARPRGQMKRVMSAQEGASELHRRARAGQAAAVLFGRERTGLENDDVSLADAIVTFPVSAAVPSLNLAQAVLLVAYEWARASGAGPPFTTVAPSPPASRAAVLALFAHIEGELDRVGFYPADKRATMTRNMRDMFLRMGMSEQDVRTFRGAITALAEGRRGKRT